MLTEEQFHQIYESSYSKLLSTYVNKDKEDIQFHVAELIDAAVTVIKEYERIKSP